MNIVSCFIIENSKKIISHLSLLVKSRTPLHIRFEDNEDSYSTTLVTIDKQNNALILDCSPREYLNQQTVQSEKVTFETEYQGIKVSFTGSDLKLTNYKGNQAFMMPLPSVLYWPQRRESYRIKLPLSNISYCQLLLGDKKPIDFQLYDISVDGFSMLNISKNMANLLPDGAIFKNCKLILSDTDEAVVSFEIRSKYFIDADETQKTQKIGCKLINVPYPVERIIQQKIQELQRSQLKKKP